MEQKFLCGDGNKICYKIEFNMVKWRYGVGGYKEQKLMTKLCGYGLFWGNFGHHPSSKGFYSVI